MLQEVGLLLVQPLVFFVTAPLHYVLIIEDKNNSLSSSVMESFYFPFYF